MERVLSILEPRSAIGVAARFLGFIVLMALANVVFAFAHDGRLLLDPEYYIMHAIFVGGPFTAFFSVVMMLQIRLKRELTVLSRTDGLTGLNNRRTFLEDAERRRREGKTGVLLLIDADNFKKINDTHGHQVGDDCLRAISYILQRNTRQEDVVGRIGGEEFAIFLGGATIQQARTIGERLTRPIPFSDGPNGKRLTVTLSVGAAMAGSEFSLDRMFINADQALYRAKETGRARLVFSDRDTTEKLTARPH